MSDVTLRVTNADAGRPARVQMLDTRHTLHGDVVLGPGQYEHDFTVPKGPYIIQIERAGTNPEQVLRVLEKDDSLEVAERPDATVQVAAKQRKQVAAARRRARRGTHHKALPNITLTAPELGRELSSNFLGSILAQYTGRRPAAIDTEGLGVTREGSGFRLPEASGQPSPAEKAKRRRAKLRSRFRLTIADHATIPGRVHLHVAEADNVPGDNLTILGPIPLEVEIEPGYRRAAKSG